jgi:lysophospholipase L1-like esterase
MILMVIGLNIFASPPEPGVCAELKLRGGASNVWKKIQAGESIRVGYLGGSITLAEGWRVKTTEWLRETYPDNEIIEINSAISGTGAGFGACRVSEHILQHHPDLLFVEFRVNGGDNSMLRSAEGIVRQTRKLLPDTDIVFVYTISQPMLNEVRAGKTPGESGLGLERVAEHYNISSIDCGPQVVQLEAEGKLVFKAESASEGVVLFTKDGVHPGDEGHEIYFEVIQRTLKKILEHESPVAAPLPEPLDKNCWERGALVDPEPFLTPRSAWRTQSWENSSVIQSFQALWAGIECDRIIPAVSQTGTPGSAIEFTFKGTAFGFFDIGGPETGSVRITIDGGTPYDVPRFINYCYRYRPQYYFSEDLPDAAHQVRIELTELTLDKKQIVGEEVYSSSPEFRRNMFYPVKLLVNGEILTEREHK